MAGSALNWVLEKRLQVAFACCDVREVSAFILICCVTEALMNLASGNNSFNS